MLPCSDISVCIDDIVTSEHNHSDSEEGHCAPFCSCACCGIAFIVYDFQSRDEIAVPTNNFSSENKNNYSFSFLNRIWQPPT